MESTIYTVDGKEFELQHYGVKGMKWGVRKKPEPYRQDLGGGVTAVWPSKKVYKKAEKVRLKREKKDLRADAKTYRQLRSEFSRSISKSIDRKTTDADREANALKLQKVADFVRSKSMTKGRAYVDRMISQANKSDKTAAAAVTVTSLAAATAATAGLAYLQARFDL